MFKVKRLDIDFAHEYVAILKEKDAKELSLSGKDRIKLIDKKTNKSIICVLEVAKENNKNLKLKNGEIGVFSKAFEKLELTEKKLIEIAPAKKPKSLEFVKAKASGKKRLSEDEFFAIVTDIVENRYSEIETTYFVIACTIHSLNDKETVNLTNAMTKVGKVLDFRKNSSDIIVDKHCIGGIPGNRTSMVVVPIVAAAGLIIPKSSSRAITSPAGTADTVEVLCDVEIPLTKMHKEVLDIGASLVWGGSLELSPADDLIIHVEHPLEIDSEGQMIASILSKKKSVGSTHVLIDIPVGKTAKVKNIIHAQKLKRRFIKIGRAVGLNIKVIITDGSEPIGDGIGPLYEAYDVLSVLKNEEGCSRELREKSLYMSGLILEMAGKAEKNRGYYLAEEILMSGSAYEKFDEILKYQGKKETLPKPKYSYEFKSNFSGQVISIDNIKVAKLAFMLGAPKDKTAGLIMKKKTNSIIEKDDVLFEIFSSSELKLKYAKNYLEENQIFEVK